jgi:uncharacterized protein involved in outer membrane biogenesis
MSSEEPVPRPTHPRRRRVLRAAAWTLGTIAVLGGLAAAFLPGYLKGVAIAQIREQLHREARIESISVNPFLLSARVRGLTIAQADGKSELFGFDELHTRVGLSSLFRLAPVIEELNVDRPRLHLARLAPERFNISDIIESILARPSSPEWPRFELNSLSIANATITFDDKPTGKLHKIEQARIVLPALSSFADDRSDFAEPALTAIVNGQPLELKGRTRPFDKSLETTVDLHFTNLDVPTYLGYSPIRLPLRLDRGRLTTELGVAFVRTANRGLSARVKGTLRLDDVILQDPDAPTGSPPIAAIRSVAARIAELRWPENSVRLDQVAVTAPQVVLRRDKSGQLNWQELFARGAAAPSSAPAAMEAPAGTEAPGKPITVQFAIASAEITDGAAQFDDLAAPDGPFHAEFKSIAIHARGLSNAEGAQATIDSSLVTDAGELHANSATLTLKPFGVTGELAVKQIRLGRFKPYFGGILAADLDGTAEVHARYAVDSDFNVKVTDSSLAVAGFAIRDKARVEFARIGGLAITGGEFDLAQRSITIGGVALRQCRAAIARDANGGWNFAALIKASSPTPPATAPTVPVASAAPGTPAAAIPDWSVALRQLRLERCAVQFDDRSAARTGAARILFDPIDARFDGWSSRAKSSARIDVKTGVNGAGQIAVRGTAGIAPVAADLDVEVEGLDLVPLRPYVADRLNVRLSSGAVSARGKLSLGMADALVARYRGDAGISNIASATSADGEDFLNWSSLQARGLDIALNSPSAGGGAPVPLAVALEELALSDFYSRLIVNADGTLNVQHVVATPGDPATPAAPQASNTAAAGAAGNAAAPTGAAPPPVTISRLTLSGGRINFSDRFIKPNYSANLADVSGVVAGLSSDFASRASVDIRGRYDPSAPVEIKGSINPLRGNLYLDLTATCRDIELAPLTPYAQKYAGYGITRGKLSFQVKYLIEDRKLTADNSLLLDQLTFGDKVDSPDATKLPVLFAVSLLKNAKGEIDLNLPVSGSLDDPQFSVSGIVVKLIVNLLVKAATSPFALLGALAGGGGGGGGEDLAYVGFPAGVAASPAPGQEEKLSRIAKALAERPALKLEIAGRVDPVADREALHRQALLRKIAAQPPDKQPAQGEAGASAESITIPPADYPRLLKRAYDNEKLPKPANAPGAVTELPVAEMEKALLANIEVTPEALRELGEHRARTAREALGKAGVAEERMFIVAAAAEATAEAPDARHGPRVDFMLK